jgi:hypothetical protein
VMDSSAQKIVLFRFDELRNTEFASSHHFQSDSGLCRFFFSPVPSETRSRVFRIENLWKELLLSNHSSRKISRQDTDFPTLPTADGSVSSFFLFFWLNDDTAVLSFNWFRSATHQWMRVGISRSIEGIWNETNAMSSRSVSLRQCPKRPHKGWRDFASIDSPGKSSK